MSRGLGPVLVVLPTVVAGCSGLGGPATTDAPATSEPATTASTTTTSTEPSVCLSRGEHGKFVTAQRLTELEVADLSEPVIAFENVTRGEGVIRAAIENAVTSRRVGSDRRIPHRCTCGTTARSIGSRPVVRSTVTRSSDGLPGIAPRTVVPNTLNDSRNAGPSATTSGPVVATELYEESRTIEAPLSANADHCAASASAAGLSLGTLSPPERI